MVIEHFEPFQSSLQKMQNLSSTVEYLFSMQKNTLENIQKEFEELSAELALVKKENQRYREKYGTL